MSFLDRIRNAIKPIQLSGRKDSTTSPIGWGLPNFPSVDLDAGAISPVGPGLTTDRSDPRLGHGIDDEPVPQNEVYLVLSEEERAKGFVRPVRRKYIHLRCGAVTTMGTALAETYARDPHFYGATYCVSCGTHRPVGADGEFVWDIPYPPFRTKGEYQTWLETVPPKVGT